MGFIMNHVIGDFEQEKKHIWKIGLWTIITALVLLTVSLVCNYTNLGDYCLFFGVLSGLTVEFLLLVIAERLELNNHKTS